MNPKIDLVPIDIAITLRNLDFNETTDFTYYKKPDGEIVPLAVNFGEDIIVAKAPYFQEVFRWFREQHKLQKCIDHMIIEGQGHIIKYFYQIRVNEIGLFINSLYSEDSFDTYEGAELACLKRLIGIVNQK